MKTHPATTAWWSWFFTERNRVTVLVSPPLASGATNVGDVEMATPKALEAAKVQAASYGLETIYVSVNNSAPWPKNKFL